MIARRILLWVLFVVVVIAIVHYGHAYLQKRQNSSEAQKIIDSLATPVPELTPIYGTFVSANGSTLRFNIDRPSERNGEQYLDTVPRSFHAISRTTITRSVPLTAADLETPRYGDGPTEQEAASGVLRQSVQMNEIMPGERAQIFIPISEQGADVPTAWRIELFP